MNYDFEKVKEGVSLIIEGIGHPKDDPNITNTPTRVAKMYEILLGGYDKDPKQVLTFFPSKSTTNVNLVNAQFYSFCAHHMLPYIGKVHVAYKPNGRVVGLSKIVRVPRIFAKKLTLQEDLTQSIADFFVEELQTNDVVVRIEATHSCMTLRGVRSPGAITVTTVRKGLYESDGKDMHEFEQAIKTNSVFSY